VLSFYTGADVTVIVPAFNEAASVADTIRMTTVPETRYAAEDTSKSRIALFSPLEARSLRSLGIWQFLASAACV